MSHPTDSIIRATIILEAYDPASIENDGPKAMAEYHDFVTAVRAKRHVRGTVGGMAIRVYRTWKLTWVVSVKEVTE